MPQTIDDLKKKFEELPAKVSLKFIRKAGRKAAEVIRARAEQLAPRDTGKLQGSMMIRTKKEDDTSISTSIGPSRDAWYGRLQEFGTVHHAAQPFLRPAVDEKGEEAAKLFAEELRKTIEEAFR